MSSFRFILPFDDGTVINIALEGKDVHEAYSELRRYYWNCLTTSAHAIFHNGALIGRVVPVYDPATEESRPKLELWP